MWHVVRRGRGNDRSAAATRRAPKAFAPKFEATRNTDRRWCDMESSDEDDDCSVEQDDVWARSSVSDAPSPRSDIENVAPNRDICEADDAASRSAATAEPGTPSWKKPRGDDKTRPHAASLSSGSTSTAEPTPVPVPSYPPPAPSYPPPGIYHDPPRYAATVEGMIPVFHPSGPFPECVVQGGACPIPWHPKEPHVHVMHVLFNAPDNSANATNEADADAERGRPIQWESAKEVLEAVKGRWFCSSEGPGMVYDINAKRKRVAKLWIDEDGDAVSRIWEKNLVIDSQDIYWGNSRSYFLSKQHMYENELKRDEESGTFAVPNVRASEWRPVRTAAYTSEITTLNRGQHRTYRLSFRRYHPGYGGRDQTAFLFIHGHLGSYRQGFNIAEWCTTNRSVWYTIDYAPASLAACRACEIQSQADYAATVLQDLKEHHRQVVVVAHSMGGIVSDLALARLDDDLDAVSSIHLNVPWSAGHPIFTHPALAMAVFGRRGKASTGRVRISFSSGLRDNVVPTIFTEPGILDLSRVRNVYESFTHVNLLFSRPVLSMFKEELLPLILEDQSAVSRAAGKIHDHLSDGLGQRKRPRQLHSSSRDDTGESIAMAIDRIRRIEPGTTILQVEGVRGYWEINAVSVMPKTALPANKVESGSAGDDFNTADLTRPVLSVSIKSLQGDWIPVPCDYIAHPRRISLCITNRQAHEEESASSIGSVVIRVETESPVLVLLTCTPRRQAELGVLGGKLDLSTEVVCSVAKGPLPLIADKVRGLAIVPAGHAHGSAPSSTDHDYLIVRTPQHELYLAPLRLTFSVDLERLVVNAVREGTGRHLRFGDSNLPGRVEAQYGLFGAGFNCAPCRDRDLSLEQRGVGGHSRTYPDWRISGSRPESELRITQEVSSGPETRAGLLGGFHPCGNSLVHSLLWSLSPIRRESGVGCSFR
ncbi:hypothetical protein FOL46_005601 [Perkinsus olseni]|uniref:GPI inositol-deacylase n=1 Tax=Perkinsus olseni TaxID=32597 RepID=A0A7J6LRE3_PEROL|nr:hypothetical protein FOL46_005601 [Perkinsus olseni]